MSLQINPSLYDEKLQYSDQYMPMAMMPAIVEAISNGGGGGGGGTTEPLIVTIDNETGYTNKTYKECKDAILAGQMVFYRYYYEYQGQVEQDSYFALTSLDEQSGLYTVNFGSYTFTTDDPTHTMYTPD